MAVEGKRGSVQGGPDPGGSAGRAGIAWIRTKESLKTNGQATWVSSVLPLGRGKLAEVILEGRKLREAIIDARGRRRGMGFGLGAAVGQPEAQMFQDPTDRIGVTEGGPNGACRCGLSGECCGMASGEIASPGASS